MRLITSLFKDYSIWWGRE